MDAKVTDLSTVFYTIPLTFTHSLLMGIRTDPASALQPAVTQGPGFIDALTVLVTQACS